MKLRIIHFSDLHLEASFAWMGSEGATARRRRRAQRAALDAIVELAREHEVDALTCGGDLYEHDRQTPRTGRFLCELFESLHPVPVLIAPGNHDWLGPASLYRQVDWSPNVHVFSGSRLEPFELESGVTIWGGAHRSPARTESFLDGFEVDREGIHLGLFHGTLRSRRGTGDDRDLLHAPFTLDDLRASGLDHAMLGHLHAPDHHRLYTYPGNPEPLNFGETGERGAVMLEIESSGNLTTRVLPVSGTELHEVSVDVTGHGHLHSLQQQVTAALSGLEGLVRLRLHGEQDPALVLSRPDFAGLADVAESVKVEWGDLRPALDLDHLAREKTVRGRFIQKVRASDLPPERQGAVLRMGLRALDGNRDPGGL